MGKKQDALIEVQEGREFSGRTIVGGQPLERRSVRLSIPAGIEKALYMAAVDPGFRALLREDRRRAIEERGLRLTESESLILETVPDDRLELMIRQIRPARHGKRAFMKTIATAVVTLATGTAGVAVEGCTPGGSAEDASGDAPSEVVDAPDEVIVDSFPEAVGGIWPDDPPGDVVDAEDEEEDAETD